MGNGTLGCEQLEGFSLVWSGALFAVSGPLHYGCCHPPIYELNFLGLRVFEPDAYPVRDQVP